MLVAICTPSRGLIFSKTVQSIVEGMQALNKIGIATKYFSSHDLPIPDSHNFTVEQAFQDSAVDKIFFVEEDMYIFPEAFVALATSEADITTLQYNDKNGSPNGIIHYNEAGEAIWAGLGATVIKRTVLEALGIPYFRTNQICVIKKKTREGDRIITEYEPKEVREEINQTTGKLEKVEEKYIYGGLDIDFYTRARKAGYKITVLPDHKAHHFDLVQLGEKQINNGCHVIKQV